MKRGNSLSSGEHFPTNGINFSSSIAFQFANDCGYLINIAPFLLNLVLFHSFCTEFFFEPSFQRVALELFAISLKLKFSNALKCDGYK